jgi:hypothetical protein
LAYFAKQRGRIVANKKERLCIVQQYEEFRQLMFYVAHHLSLSLCMCVQQESRPLTAFMGLLAKAHPASGSQAAL